VAPTVTKLVDTSTCIGCKACEVACQEWNDLPPEPTVQSGTYQTMPSTTANFWNLIKFNERSEQVGVVVAGDALLDSGDALEARACVDGGARQGNEGAVRLPVVLHEHEVPDLEKPSCLGADHEIV
jgi:Fe-S-cluster-containing dehydrogenase component